MTRTPLLDISFISMSESAKQIYFGMMSRKRVYYYEPTILLIIRKKGSEGFGKKFL
jgi:hypothetical protein